MRVELDRSMSAKMVAKRRFFALCVLIGFGKACIGAEPSDAANDNIRQPSTSSLKSRPVL